MSQMKLSQILIFHKGGEQEKIGLYEFLLNKGELLGNYQPDVEILKNWMEMSDEELGNMLRENEEIREGESANNLTRTAALLLAIAGEAGTMDSYIWFINEMQVYPLKMRYSLYKTVQLHGEPLGFLSYLIAKDLLIGFAEHLPTLPKGLKVELISEDEESDITTYSYRLGGSVFEGTEIASKEELLERWKKDIQKNPRLVNNIIDGREFSLTEFFEGARNLAKANWTLLTDPTDSFDIEMVKKFYGVYNNSGKVILLSDQKEIVRMIDQDTRKIKKLSISMDGAIEMLMEVGRAALYFHNHGLDLSRIAFVQVGSDIQPYITQFSSSSVRTFDTSFLEHFYDGSDRIDEIRNALREANFNYFASN